jgi:hypothetical protein
MSVRPRKARFPRSTKPATHLLSSLPPFPPFSHPLAGAVSKTIVAPIERVKLVLQVQDVNKEQIPEAQRYKGESSAVRAARCAQKAGSSGL